MSGAAELAVGVVALLAGFNGAVGGYKLISEIDSAFEGVSFLTVKLKVENERLRIWGDFYGFTETEKCARLKDASENTRSLILYVLMEISMATTDVERLVQRYGLKMVDVGDDLKSTTDLYQKLRVPSVYVENLAKEQARLDTMRPDLRKKIRWTITDGARFEKLVDRLAYLNDSLEKIVPKSDIEMLALGLSSYILPAQSSDSSLNVLQQSGQQMLASCATMKQIKLSRTAIPSPVPLVDEKDLDQDEPLSDPFVIRTPATWTRKSDSQVFDVLIEWKEINRSLPQNHRDLVYSRVRNLASLMSVPKPGPFCLLSCLGIVEDTQYANTYIGHKRIGYVFRYPNNTAPNTHPTTLQDIIHAASTTKDKQKRYAPLGERFRLAQSLASALLLLHSSKWLHRNFRSSNVIFFTPRGSQSPAIVAPYLTGFEFSRPEGMDEPSLGRPQLPPATSGSSIPPPADPYLHPSLCVSPSKANAVPSKSTRLTDIYALGILLFEIAIWRPVSNYAKPTAEETRDMLLHNVSLILPGSVGETYAQVVRRCLSGDLGASNGADESDKEFWKTIVRELDGCRA